MLYKIRVIYDSSVFLINSSHSSVACQDFGQRKHDSFVVGCVAGAPLSFFVQDEKGRIQSRSCSELAHFDSPFDTINTQSIPWESLHQASETAAYMYDTECRALCYFGQLH